MRQYTRNQEPRGMFPNEYRNFFIPDSMTVIIPPGFDFRPGSAEFYHGYTSGVFAVPDSKVTQVGNKLFFTNLKSFYTRFGGTIVAGDETEYITLYFNLDPQCEAVNGTFESQHHTSGVGNGVNTPLSYGTTSRPTYSWDYLVQGVGWVYTAPQPVLSGGGVQYSSDGTATWNLALQNQSNLVAAPFQWLAITNRGVFTNVVVKKNNVIVPMDADSIYQLGDLAAAGQFNITISATGSACNTDSMKVITQWDCQLTTAAFNPGFKTQTCNQAAWLKIQAYPSQIQITVAKQPIVLPAVSVPLCNVNTAEFVINSAQAAFANNVVFQVVPPTGVAISMGQIEYPLGSGNWQTITPIITPGNVHSYSVESHTGVSALWGTRGLPGTIENPNSNERQAKLRVTFTTDCNFTSGAKLLVRQQGIRPCGTLIPTALGYNSLVRTDPIIIDGATSAGSLGFNLSFTPSIISCVPAKLSGSVTPIGIPTSNTDTITVTLPEGIKYFGVFTGGTNFNMVAGYPKPGPLNTTILRIKVASGRAVGVPLTYSFFIEPDVTAECRNYEIVTEAERSFAPLMCGMLVCPTLSKSVVGSSLNTITVDKPDVEVLSVSTVSGSYIGGTPVTVHITAFNKSTTATAAANSLLIGLSCTSNPNTPFITVPFNQALPPNTTATVSITFIAPDYTLCANGDRIQACIKPTATSCLCDTVCFEIPNSTLPLDEIDLMVTKVGNTSQLQYKVDRATPSAIYVIQRSTDGINFTDLGSINDNGNTVYNYTDINPILQTKNYYRVKQISVNGQNKLSIIKWLNFASGGKIEIYPNPASTLLNVNITENYIGQNVRLSLINSIGQTVITSNIGAAQGSYAINVSKLPSGTYILRLQSGNTILENKKVIVAQ
jgi:hypothetical protein